MYLFASLLLLVWLQHSHTLVPIQFGSDYDSNRITGLDETKLTKRATVGNKLFQGLKAVKYLLKDSKPMKDRPKFMTDDINEFQKSGGYRQAHRDFLAIKPRIINELGEPGSSVTMGQVGNRLVILYEKGYSNMPMIEIKKVIGRSFSPDLDVIYYKDL